ncbi:hypothetical protein Q3G72_000472 [Acer saccharum]|nr:hypothetical protein Q3G72_000472 [Acer saccharum]
MHKCKPFHFFNAAVEHAGDSNQSWLPLASPVVIVIGLSLVFRLGSSLRRVSGWGRVLLSSVRLTYSPISFSIWSLCRFSLIVISDFVSQISINFLRRSCTFKLRTFVTPFDLLNRIKKVGDSEETNPYSSKNTVEHAEVGGGRES